MPWPTTNEFLMFLAGAGLETIPQTAIQTFLDLDGALAAAVEEWNDLTHYIPFLSTGVLTEERRFNPTLEDAIDLDGGLLTLTSLTTGITYSNPTGVVRVNVQDFKLWPSDAAPKKLPWTRITKGPYFWWGWDSMEDLSIKVIGEWGYCTDANLPSTARRAVMALAAQSLMPQIALQLRHGGLISFQQGDSTKKWGDLIENAPKVWQGMIDIGLRTYVRCRIA